jgi:hypothetical protein
MCTSFRTLPNLKDKREETKIVKISALLSCISDLLAKSSTMPKPKAKKHYTHLPPPPRSPTWYIDEAATIAAHNLQDYKAKKWQVEYMLGMLHESYICILPRLKKDKSDMYDRSPKQLCSLWVTWYAKLLGWRDQQGEGHP